MTPIRFHTTAPICCVLMCWCSGIRLLILIRICVMCTLILTWYVSLVKYLDYDCLSPHLGRLKCSTVRCRFNAVNFIKNYLQKTLHSSPVRARYGVSVDPTSNWHAASVSVIIYVISYYIGPGYNGTRLYLVHEHHRPYTARLFSKVFCLSASRSLVRDILFISCSLARSLHASF